MDTDSKGPSVWVGRNTRSKLGSVRSLSGQKKEEIGVNVQRHALQNQASYAFWRMDEAVTICIL